MPLSKTTTRIVNFSLTGLVLYFLFAYWQDEFSDFSFATIHFNYGWLVCAQFAFFLYLFFGGCIWHLLTIKNQVQIDFKDALAIWFYSILGKYVPGKALLWGIRIFKYREQRAEISLSKFFVCLFIEYVGGIGTGVLLLVLTVSFVREVEVPWELRMGSLVLLPCCLIALYPPVLGFTIRRLGKLIGKTIGTVELAVVDTISILAMIFLNWFMLGFCAYCSARAVFEAPLSLFDFLHITVAYVFAGIVGFLAIFAPSGIGVREGVFVASVSSVLPVQYAVLCAVLVRLVSVVGEVGGAGIAWTLRQTVHGALDVDSVHM